MNMKNGGHWTHYKNRNYWMYRNNVKEIAKMPHNYRLDEAFDLFHFIFVRIVGDETNKMINIPVIELYMKMLNDKKIFTINDYKPNCVTVRAFIKKTCY